MRLPGESVKKLMTPKLFIRPTRIFENFAFFFHSLFLLLVFTSVVEHLKMTMEYFYPRLFSATRKNSRGTKTQEIVNPRKTLKLKQKICFPAFLGAKVKQTFRKSAEFTSNVSKFKFYRKKNCLYHFQISCCKLKTPDFKRFSRFFP